MNSNILAVIWNILSLFLNRKLVFGCFRWARYQTDTMLGDCGDFPETEGSNRWDYYCREWAASNAGASGVTREWIDGDGHCAPNLIVDQRWRLLELSDENIWRMKKKNALTRGVESHLLNALRRNYSATSFIPKVKWQPSFMVIIYYYIDTELHSQGHSTIQLYHFNLL